MLNQLHIRNFVLVEQLMIDFQSGLTCITGETGAGKSILIQALGLLLGDRADIGVIRHGCQQADISAIFEPNQQAAAWLSQQSLDSDECIIRRVINQTGRSRCYINGTPTSVQNLITLGEFLVDIHGQHAHQSLLKPISQRILLDAAMAKPKLLKAVGNAYAVWSDVQQALTELGGDSRERLGRLDLLRYQVSELLTLDLENNHLARLETEHSRLSHADNLLEQVQLVEGLLAADGAVLQHLNQASRALQTVQLHDESHLTPLIELLDSATIQTQEACDGLQHYLNQLEVDPSRLSWINQYFSQLQDVARKHHIKVDALPVHLQTLQQQLSDLEHYEERAAELEDKLQQARVAYQDAAQRLSEARQQRAKKLSAEITKTMQPLGLPKAVLHIEVSAHIEQTPSPQGYDQIRFLVSTNVGQAGSPLHKVVSGGELSRISLAIQVITAQNSAVNTLVFDEVDVGVGGAIAEIIAQQLRQLGQQRQVLCITHLPQVAAYGQQHLHVQKHNSQNATQTDICLLDATARVDELARMLGGLEITEQTRAHAQEMLNRCPAVKDLPH